jgi:hypothetical protein
MAEVARRHRCRHCKAIVVTVIYRLFRKFDLNAVECAVTLRRPIAVSVGMDRNLDKIEAGRLR